MLLDDRPATWTSPHSGEAGGVLLDAMATVQLGEDRALADGLAQLRRGGGDGIVVAVLGEVGEEEAMGLARLGREGVPGVALLLRTTSWTALPPGRAAEFDDRRAKAAQILRQADWRVAEAGPERTVTQAWDDAVKRRQDAARLAAGARSSR
jgi:hypothetical protein